MKKIFSFIAICFCCSVSAQDSLVKLPSEKLPRINDIDVKHIVLNLHFNWKSRQAAGTASITLSTLKKTNQISLDTGALSILSVTKDGKTLSFQNENNAQYDNFKITLDRTYQVGETLTVTVDYHTNHVNDSDPNNLWGSFGKGLRFFEPTSAVPTRRKQIWSSGEPDNNRYWFPCVESLADWRSTELVATVEKPLIVISNGNLIKTTENDDGTRTFHYKSDEPYANHLTSLVVGNYVAVKQNYQNTALLTFGYPDEKEAIEATVERLPDMVKFFSETTGVDYPYSHFTQAVVQDYPFPTLGGQHTAVIQSDNMIDDFRTHADFYYLWDGIESETLASQWFGNLISPRDWKDVWLNASFAHYLNGLYTDHKNGHDEYLSYYQSTDMATVQADWDSGYRHAIVTRNYEDLATFTSDNYTRIRGAMVLRMLRKELGEANWQKVFQYYVKYNAGKPVSTEDFQKALKAVTGDTMQWFFDQWLYTVGMPEFEVEKNYDAKQKVLALRVKQIQKVDSKNPYPQTQYFRGKIEVEIDDSIVPIDLEAKGENVFTFPMNVAPKLVQFDFENTWIRKLKFEKSFEEYLYQLEKDQDLLGRFAATDALVKIAKDQKTNVSDKEKIYRSFYQILEGKNYWRLKTYVLVQLRTILPLPYDENTINLLLKLSKSDQPWLRTSALTTLGMTKDPKFADWYLTAFSDDSDRVINAAANALGKSKSEKAFDALMALSRKPSWKSQSMISALNGLKELGDPRGAELAHTALRDNHSARWFLATPIWDYPIAAAQTLVALGKSEAAFPMLFDRFKTSLGEKDVNAIFSQLLLLTTLADSRTAEAFALLREQFQKDTNAMQAIEQAQNQFNESIKKKEN